MNKLFNKIATGIVGIALAIGVGVAVGSKGSGATRVRGADPTTTLTWGGSSSPYSFSWSDSGDTYFQISYGGNADIDAYSSDFRMYSSTWFTISTKSAYSLSYKIKKVAITGKSSKNTNYLYYKASTGEKVTQSGTGVTPLSWSTSSSTNTADFGDGLNSVTIARATSGNQVRITQLVVTYVYEAPTYYTVTLGVASGQTGYGSVSPSSIANVPSGTTVSISSNTITINGTTATATPAPQTVQYTYAFSSWSVSSGTSIKSDTTITASFTRTTRTYSVTGSITNGSLSATSPIQYGSAVNATLNPSTHYHRPTSLTSVTMGGTALSPGDGILSGTYSYNSSTGAIYIKSLTGAVVVTATCIEDDKYSITYTKGDHGTGSNYVVNNVYAGSYTLATFAETGLSAVSGYAFYKWSVGGNEYSEGASITISGATIVTAVYSEVAVLTYDKNGGTGTTVTETYAKGGTATVADNTYTAPTGKAFSKWNTRSDGTGTSYSKDDTFTISDDITLYAQWIPVLDITISNFTEITTNYDSYYTHTYTVATHNSTTTMDVEAHGVYKNANGIQMNSGKGTYIKNVDSLPAGAYITKIICEWTATGKNSPTLYVAKDSVATTSSTSLGVGSNTELVQTFTVSDALSYKYNYFYFDGTTVTGACYLKHLMICYDFNDELQSIAVNATQEQLTYTVGQVFNFSGSVTPTRLLSGAGDPTTSNLTFKLNGTAITAGSYTFAKADHGKTLNVTYTEGGVSKNANAPYTIIVNYEAVTSISLNLASTTIGLEGSVDLTATILSDNADPTVTWGVTPSASLVEDTNFEYITEGKRLTLSMIKDNEETGTITVTATATGYIDDTETPDLRATCTITVAGAKSVSLSTDSMSGHAGSGNNHRGSITATANNFTSPTYTWEVVSETVSGMVTFSASTSATTYVNYVKAGTATIRCGAQEGGSGDYTYSDTITVAVASDSVSEVNWTTSNITCYSGTIFSTSTITSWSPTYTMSSGDTGSITSNYIVKLNGTEFTLGTALEAGTYTVTLTYGGVTTSINNPTLTVIQRLNTITDDDSGTYSWTAGSGDQTTIAAAGASGSFTLVGQSWTIDRDSTATTNLTDSCVQIGSNGNATNFSLTTNFGSNAIIDEVAVEASSYSAAHTIGCTVGGTTYVATQATASWKTVSEVKGTGSSKGNVVIKYTAGSGARAAYIKSITVKWHSSENIANSISHYNAQAAVVEFAQYMNTQMTATNVCDGDMSKLSTAWTNVSTKYNTLFGSGTSLNPTELAFAKKMLSSATAKWDETHDSDELYCLEKAMKTYEWCVSHYKETCNPFMSEVRPVKSIHISPYLNILGSNPNTAAIVIIVSVLSVAAVGGYFLFRKKKEQ